MKWFKHDSDAHMDAKLKRVQIKYGMVGYGLYWYCLELIASNVKQNSITFELDHDAEIISHDTGLHYEVVQEMITYMVDLGLFENNQGIITCLKIAKRLDSSMTSNPEMRKIIQRLNQNSHDPIMTQSADSHDPIMIKSEQNRLDKNRLDKKRKTNSRFTPPTLEEVTQYCQERNNEVDPARFIDFYETGNWMRGKTPIKSWKACVRTWEDKNPGVNESLSLGAI